MTIADVRGKCKSALGKIPRDVLVITIIILTAFASFGLGYLAGRDEVKIGDSSSLATPELPSAVGVPTEGGVVASKNGTKYYLPTCAGAQRISEGNKVWFTSAAAATAAGYAPAANCKGL